MFSKKKNILENLVLKLFNSIWNYWFVLIFIPFYADKVFLEMLKSFEQVFCYKNNNIKFYYGNIKLLKFRSYDVFLLNFLNVVYVSNFCNSLILFSLFH